MNEAIVSTVPVVVMSQAVLYRVFVGQLKRACSVTETLCRSVEPWLPPLELMLRLSLLLCYSSGIRLFRQQEVLKHWQIR